jgi:hypothetical protein
MHLILEIRGLKKDMHQSKIKKNAPEKKMPAHSLCTHGTWMGIIRVIVIWILHYDALLQKD